MDVYKVYITACLLGMDLVITALLVKMSPLEFTEHDSGMFHKI